MQPGFLLGRVRHAVIFAPLVVQLVAWAPPLSRPAVAQKPGTPRDSAPNDSAPRKPTGIGCEMCLAAVLAAFWTVTLIAPSSMLLVKKALNPPPGALPDSHLSAYFAGGGGGLNHGANGWAHSENVEVLRHGLYGEVRIENFYAPDHIQFQTVRAGYLAHPKPQASGGVTLGYRTAHGDGGRNALEIGVPLAVGNERGAFRAEATYLISPEGVTWNYRLQMELYIPSKRLVTGFDFEAKPYRQNGPYFGEMALLLGVRF
jgi:hypothetical protein